MTETRSDEVNPYKAPESAAAHSTVLDDQATAEIAWRFREESRALGLAWIIAAILTVVVVLNLVPTRMAVAPGAGSPSLLQTAILIASAMLGVTLFPIGILTIGKNLLAVRIGVTVNYALLVLQLLNLNLCVVFFLIMFILQGHRVSRWGHRLRILNALLVEPEN